MAYELKPCPKPASRVKANPPELRKTRMKSRNAKRKGSSFPKQRHPAFTRWLTTENPCFLAGRYTRERLSLVDRVAGDRFEHQCWSVGTRPPIDPAHVGKHRSKGAPDFGATVPLCHVAHAFYDNHRDKWGRVTGFSERKMASAASGYALKYVEQGGTPLKENSVNNTTIAPRVLSREELADDFKRALISVLLGKRTWSSADLSLMLTVGEVAERLALRL